MSSEQQPQQSTMITLLNQRLDQKANEVRRLEHGELLAMAMASDLETENARLRAEVDQLRAQLADLVELTADQANPEHRD